LNNRQTDKGKGCLPPTSGLITYRPPFIFTTILFSCFSLPSASL
jgi:hypothetical protein